MNIQIAPRKKWLLFGFSSFLFLITCSGIFLGGWFFGTLHPWLTIRSSSQAILNQPTQIFPSPLTIMPYPLLIPFSTEQKQSSVQPCDLLVELRDTQGKPLPQTKVFLQKVLPRMKTSSPPGIFEKQGELGVLKQKNLPYPDDIISYSSKNLHHKENGITSTIVAESITDQKGYAHFTKAPPGALQIIAYANGTSAQVEIQIQSHSPSDQTEICLSQEGYHLILSLQANDSNEAATLSFSETTSLFLNKKVEIELINSNRSVLPNVIIQGKVGSSYQSCVTNVQGKCSLFYDAAQELLLEVQHAPFARFTKKYAPTTLEKENLISIQLYPGGEIEGYAWDTRTKSLQEPIQLLFISETQEQLISVEKNGHFHLKGVPLEPFSLQARSTHYIPLKKDFSLSNTQTMLRDIRLELVRAGRLEGKIQGKEQKVKLDAYNEDGILVGTIYSSTQGKYLFPTLPPGKITIKVDGSNKEIFVQIYPDHTQYEEINLP